MNDHSRGRFTRESIEALEDIASNIGEALLRKQAESELRDSQERLDHLIAAAQDAIIMMDGSGAVSLWNESAIGMLGYSKEEAIGQHLHSLVTPARFHAAYERAFRQFRSTGRGTAVGRTIELSARRKDGCEVPVELSLSPVLIGGEWHSVGILRDISERKRLEAQHDVMETQLRQAQKVEAIGQLAGGVAHDFNNILAAVMMILGLLDMRTDLDEDVRSGLAEISAEVKRASDLTRQLLMFSRRSVPAAKPLDLNDIVSNLLKMLTRLIPEDIELRFHPSGALPSVVADAGLLEQVLMNLVVNARDAVSKGGRITISTRRRVFDPDDVLDRPGRRAGEFVSLEVADTGRGIDTGTLKRIFEPFFTTKESGKGTGLGLATVDGIVAQHKGWVEVSSEVAVGTTFRVYLPAAESEAVMMTGPQAVGQMLGGQETLLVVEDETRVRRFIAQSLRALGYQVFEAANGHEAMSVWQAHGPQIDLVLTDMVMPEGMSGMELADLLQAAKPGLKVIVSSGYSAEIVQAGVPASSGVVYLPKPYDNRLLAGIIRDCLDRGHPAAPSES